MKNCGRPQFCLHVLTTCRNRPIGRPESGIAATALFCCSPDCQFVHVYEMLEFDLEKKNSMPAQCPVPTYPLPITTVTTGVTTVTTGVTTVTTTVTTASQNTKTTAKVSSVSTKFWLFLLETEHCVAYSKCALTNLRPACATAADAANKSPMYVKHATRSDDGRIVAIICICPRARLSGGGGSSVSAALLAVHMYEPPRSLPHGAVRPTARAAAARPAGCAGSSMGQPARSISGSGTGAAPALRRQCSGRQRSGAAGTAGWVPAGPAAPPRPSGSECSAGTHTVRRPAHAVRRPAHADSGRAHV